MTYNNIFSETEGITSTSANHLCNLAKSEWEQTEVKLNNLNFATTTINLLGTESEKTISVGISEEKYLRILDQVGLLQKLKAFTSYFREAIKQKEMLVKNIQQLSFTEYIQENNIELPDVEIPEKLTLESYLKTLPVDTQVKYFTLEAKTAALGKLINPGGQIYEALQKARLIASTPIKVEKDSNQTLIYNSRLEIDLERLEELYSNTINHYRESQKQLNTLKYDLESQVSDINLSRDNVYKEQAEKRISKRNIVHKEYVSFMETESKKIQDLKILIPNELRVIYDYLNKLGK